MSTKVDSNLAKIVNLAFGWNAAKPDASLRDRVLDALDDAPVGYLEMSDGSPDYHGPIATIQRIARAIGVSDGAARSAVHQLHEAGLVSIWDGLDPHIGHRRLYVSAVAA
ncbi:MarR family transcriptional regulator [Mycobacteroides abscessus]|uniref:MarR family transcriptional regulator n=1 Tax=Mycobacteroides abscessus TaxID=36809 RepID=UPI0023300D6E|nr:helix-turn-helix domain-containing protein [Mycobacteroides abscessus]MDB2222336.1 helix-turn-helix domain-containing protein [Mycobacteroides abscessus subsp. abscessus]